MNTYIHEAHQHTADTHTNTCTHTNTLKYARVQMPPSYFCLAQQFL